MEQSLRSGPLQAHITAFSAALAIFWRMRGEVEQPGTVARSRDGYDSGLRGCLLNFNGPGIMAVPRTEPGASLGLGRFGAGAMTCPKLSSTINSRRGRRYDSTSVISLEPVALTPSAAATAYITSSAARTELRPANGRRPRSPGSAGPPPPRRAALPTLPGPGQGHQPHALLKHQILDRAAS